DELALPRMVRRLPVERRDHAGDGDDGVVVVGVVVEPRDARLVGRGRVRERSHAQDQHGQQGAEQGSGDALLHDDPPPTVAVAGHVLGKLRPPTVTQEAGPTATWWIVDVQHRWTVESAARRTPHLGTSLPRSRTRSTLERRLTLR